MGANYINDVVKIYFARLFPFKELYQWLSYGNGEMHFSHRYIDVRSHSDQMKQTFLHIQLLESIFTRREFALIFEGERFLRHQAYSNMDELKRFIKKEKPIKIDIGAVYNVSLVSC